MKLCWRAMPREGDEGAMDSGIACAEHSPNSLCSGWLAAGQRKRSLLAANAPLACQSVPKRKG